MVLVESCCPVPVDWCVTTTVQASTVETVLYLLEDVDLPTTPAKKTSRELSGERNSHTHLISITCNFRNSS